MYWLSRKLESDSARVQNLLAACVLDIYDGEDLWQWSRLEIRLNAFRRATIPQKQFIIIHV